ncbi:hypothetical protein CCR97_21080 [Rhodoplanes elegans]|uniref:Uncharacterized protein n=1 Tax=Rhodoplanes elegans TaxID=29408 RepID=A0A327K454_9BRAD|nr:hypothetical protein [Rhodoplanes elegans]MBK5960676.1 hypothetical protein [Rhodoplanes elegans]RAI33530.1 hypothetical protein CH338_22360 [Rhodoplanes elegans]
MRLATRLTILSAALLACVALSAAAPRAVGAPTSASDDDPTLFQAAVAETERRNRAAILAIAERDRPRAKADLAGLREAFGQLAERFGKTRIIALKGETDGVTLLVDLPMRIVTAQMMVDFGRADAATAPLIAVCRLLITLHIPADPAAAAACEAEPR